MLQHVSSISYLWSTTLRQQLYSTATEHVLMDMMSGWHRTSSRDIDKSSHMPPSNTLFCPLLIGDEWEKIARMAVDCISQPHGFKGIYRGISWCRYIVSYEHVSIKWAAETILDPDIRTRGTQQLYSSRARAKTSYHILQLIVENRYTYLYLPQISSVFKKQLWYVVLGRQQE